MISVAPVLTSSGKALQLRALGGEQIIFTKFKLGSGTPTGTGESLTDLVTPKLSFPISEIDDENEGYISVSGHFSNDELTESFKWTELGLFCAEGQSQKFSGDGSTKTFTITAKPSAVVRVEVGGTSVTVDSYVAATGVVTLHTAPASGTNNVEAFYPSSQEALYSYAYDANGGRLVYDATDVTLDETATIVVAIGDAENVTAVVSASAQYASKSQFEAHVANTSNPHSVTKEQVGLGNVENKAVNDLTPTYTEATAISSLVSGEKISVAFGKIAKAIGSIVSHIQTVTGNPHQVSLTDVAGSGYTNNITMTVTFADETTKTYYLVGKDS